MKGISTVTLCALLLASCDRSPYPGYSIIDEGVHLRLITLGEGEETVSELDSVRMRFRAAVVGEEPGSLLSTERTYPVAALRIGALHEVFRDLHEGDSMSVITTVERLPWSIIAPEGVAIPGPGGSVQLELLLMDIRTPATWQAEQERMRRNDPIGFERRIIHRYMEGSGKEWTRWGTSDMYYRISGMAVDTNRVRKGEMVSIQYSGRRLEDGREFDATERNGDPFAFRFGDTDQVIRGLEVAVSLLRHGQQGTFLFPSELAFGARGIEGIIEPWTAVEYTVELVSVERALR